MNNPLDNLTVCVTSFRRGAHLARALLSLRSAGIRRVTIAAVCPTPEVLAVIEAYRSGWLSYDVSIVRDDIGCNATWLVAAYRSRTDRIIVLHDDDGLWPQFAAHYAGVIAPALDAKLAGFATWEACHRFEDGTTKPCHFREGGSGVFASSELLQVVGRFGRLSLSPVVSILDRATVIDACKEAEQTLTDNACLQRPGMLLGTEVLVYLRHIAKFKQWLYLGLDLSFYGYHAGSGTIQAATPEAEAILADGYDLARLQSAKKAPALLPRLLLAYSHYDKVSAEEAARNANALASWEWHFGTGQVIELPIPDRELRTSTALGDFRVAAFVKDVLDRAALHARPEDVIVYINRDVGLTTHAQERLLSGIERGRGVTVCFRRSLTPTPGRLYKSVLNCRYDGGFDVMAMTAEWWKRHRAAMPDMLLGREAWDTVFRTLADEWVAGEKIKEVVTIVAQSAAYTDDVCWHQDHVSDWQIHRKTSPGNLHNLKLARDFYAARGIRLVSESLPEA